MNLITLEGRLLHIEPRTRSFILTVQVGVQRNTRDTMWSIVPKVSIRVPRRMIEQDAMERLKINNYYEMYGHINPLLFKNRDGEGHSQNTEFVLSGFSDLLPVPGMSAKQIERSLYSRYEVKGVLVDYIPNRRERNPDNAIIQIRSKLEDNPNTPIQGHDRIIVSVRPQMKERMAGIEIGDCVNIEGRVFGRLLRIERLMPGEFETTLYNALGLSRIRVSGVQPAWAKDGLSIHDREEIKLDEDAEEDEEDEHFVGSAEDYAEDGETDDQAQGVE